ncbi:YMR114C [Saccharomyces arboricola H-6]|uniref:YMR114C n=1 Tax=Saccharomyces arboricola (strain H-6 / AS 2.3317 / CBS 10644) TaxID=1160507 RepID=J8Q6I1_SACAR|nr:YMR114C [Saccharomyces arboricola H-6]
MCGRFALAYDSGDLPRLLREWNLPVNTPSETSLNDQRSPDEETIKDQTTVSEQIFEASYNVSPTNYSAVYRPDTEAIQFMKWGLVPFWAKDASQFKTYRTFNARLENLQQSRMWIRPCERKRCAIPMSGYFEWKTVGKRKTPYFISRRDGKLMFVAGMYDYVEKEGLYTFTIITAQGPRELDWLHERMPCVIEPNSKSWDAWMDVNKTEWSTKELVNLLKPEYDKSELQFYQVMDDVGKTTNNGERLIKPLLKEDSDMFSVKIEKKEALLKTDDEEVVDNNNIGNDKFAKSRDYHKEKRDSKRVSYDNLAKNKEHKETITQKEGSIGDRVKREGANEPLKDERSEKKRNIVDMLGNQKDSRGKKKLKK